MPSNIVVALWSPEHNWSSSLAIRLHKLDNRLGVTNQWITARGAELTTSAPFKGVFLAPEYYFTEPAAQRRPLTEDARLRIEGQLLELSRRYPRILMVPGTVFYQKPLVRDAGSAVNKFDPATGQRTQPKITDADRRARSLQKARNYIGRIPGQRTAADWDMNEWVGYGYGAGANPVPSLNQIRTALRDPANNPSLAKNAAYVLLGGRRIAKYDKQSDFGEALGASPDDLAFIPGAYKQCPEIGGYRIGTEICFDHGNAMLARRNVNPLHFHFVVSDWVNTSVGNMAMSAGGYFAHASTNYVESALFRRNPDGSCHDITQDVAYWKYKATAWSKLDGYVVPLPVPIAPPKPARV